jgi:hypothetical protein
MGFSCIHDMDIIFFFLIFYLLSTDNGLIETRLFLFIYLFAKAARHAVPGLVYDSLMTILSKLHLEAPSNLCFYRIPTQV